MSTLKTACVAALVLTGLAHPSAGQGVDPTVLSPYKGARGPATAELAPLLAPEIVANAERLRDQALKGDSVAYEVLEGLTTELGPRPAASPTARRAADWAVVKLKTLGFQNVHIEPFTMTAWTRGEETAEVISPFPQRLVVTALGGSVATPRQGIEAQAVLFASYDALLAAPMGSLMGKIAVVTQPMPKGGYGAYYRIRGLGPSEAAKRGAVAYLLRSLATADRRVPHTGTMTYQPRLSGPAQRPVPRIPAAALSAPDAEQLERIAKRGQPIRLHLTLTPTSRPDQIAETVVGEIVGREHPEQVVLIGGHLDSWDLGTGALDDGAGVAITVAAAKLIAGLPQPPRRTIRVALFGAEEVGQSNVAYAAAHPAGEQARHVIAAECDEGADHLYAVGLPKGAAVSSFGRTLGHVIAPAAAFIDEAPATDGGADMESLVGVPLGELKQDSSRYFELHHTADDTLDKIDRTQMDQNVAVWAAFTYLAADSDVDFRALSAAPAGP